MFTQMLRVGLIAMLVIGVGGTFAAPGLAGAPKTIDDLYADVARQAPGFGGMFVDPDQDTLYVYLLQDTPAAVADLEAALTAVFGPDSPKQSRLVVLQGQYSFLELKAWYDRMRAVVGGMPGVTLTDIDDARNRLTVGVETEEVQELVEKQLDLLGIPREVVDIEISPPEKFSLQNEHRPLVGGLQISFITGTSEPKCTLGFNAIRVGVPGFVTASHCTAFPGVEEGTEFHQPFEDNRVGVETVDRPFFEGGECPATRICRYSDSAFARRAIGVGGDLGFIAQPPLSSISWNGVDTFRIVAEAMNFAVGDHVNKVGKTTGWTRGQVTRVCADIPVSETNITLLCQGKADYAQDQGDSGAPVFNIIDGHFPNVRLYGIHATRGATATFSPIQNIQRGDELGSLITCAPGFGC